MNIDINAVVAAKLTQMQEDGVIQAQIEKGVEKAVLQALEDCFSRHGQVTQQLEKALEAGLKLNVSKLDVPTYNAQMLAGIRAQLGSVFAAQAGSRFMQEMNEMLCPLSDSMDVNDLVAKLRDYMVTDVYDRVVIGVRRKAHILDSYNLDISVEDSSGSIIDEVKLYLLSETKGQWTICINHSHRFNPTCLSKANALILRLYAAGTPITGLEEFHDSREYHK